MEQSGWKRFFTDWPAEMPRRGVLVTTFQEQVPFDGFLTSGEFLLIERQVPDPLGGRAVILPYQYVAAVKLTEALRPKALRSLGFEGTLTKG
ncbi:MAG: hypothetical protein ACUVUC_11845 [Thermoguttaceae bacterium]